MIPAILLTDSDATETSSASYTSKGAQKEKVKARFLSQQQGECRETTTGARLTRKESVRPESKPFPPQLAELVPQSSEGPPLLPHTVTQLRALFDELASRRLGHFHLLSIFFPWRGWGAARPRLPLFPKVEFLESRLELDRILPRLFPSLVQLSAFPCDRSETDSGSEEGREIRNLVGAAGRADRQRHETEAREEVDVGGDEGGGVEGLAREAGHGVEPILGDVLRTTWDRFQCGRFYFGW